MPRAAFAQLACTTAIRQLSDSYQACTTASRQQRVYTTVADVIPWRRTAYLEALLEQRASVRVAGADANIDTSTGANTEAAEAPTITNCY